MRRASPFLRPNQLRRISCLRGAGSLLTETLSNKSLDASGGSSSRNLLGAAKGALIRAAASTQPFARIAVSERRAVATRSNTQLEWMIPSLLLRVLTRTPRGDSYCKGGLALLQFSNRERRAHSFLLTENR